jgi:hypothetical protein
MNVFYRLFKGFSKYIVNMDWMFIGKEGYIDLDVIFNCIRKLFLPFLTSYKVFVLKCIIMFWCKSNFVCFVKEKEKLFFMHV